jgi:hypothetical protein
MFVVKKRQARSKYGKDKKRGGRRPGRPHENRGSDLRVPESRNCRRRGGLTAVSGERKRTGEGGKKQIGGINGQKKLRLCVG